MNTRSDETGPENSGETVMENGDSGIVALIVSAGRGHRFGGEIPKQYLNLSHKSILATSAEALLSHPKIDHVRAVIHPDDQALYENSTAELDLLPPVFGGATRQDSVRLGLESLVKLKPEKVLIHDSVRPFIDHDIINAVIDALDDYQGAIPAVPVADTLKRGSEFIQETVDRSDLWRAQTPQGFVFEEIIEGHRAVMGEELTDDGVVAERAGMKVAIVSGKESNFKITTQEDMDRAMAQYQGNSGVYKVGTGFDVHRFTKGDHVMLCGVAVPHDQGLAGHSDADVALHAITDAILGAAGAGDIGFHFPPSDPQWKNVSSDTFLAHAAKLVADQGGRVTNVDLTVICEAPKIGPYRDQMKNKIAEILNIDATNVNVKGTTTEGLGFTGRGEGIATQASINIWLPN